LSDYQLVSASFFENIAKAEIAVKSQATFLQNKIL
jgi:hypothetical protein